MLRSKLYKILKIISLILLILSMLGIKTKVFADNEYTLNLYSSNNQYGSVIGSGTYNINTANIKAIALNGCIFRGWFLDDQYQNLYSLESDLTLTFTDNFNLYALFDIENNNINEYDNNVNYAILIVLCLIYLHKIINEI